MRNRLVKTVLNALGMDPSIVCKVDKIAEAPGYDEGHFKMLGLTRSDLKRLERAGLALRGYRRDGDGFKVRWIIVGKGN